MTLPKRPMIDTGFFILANREKPDDARTAIHAEALAALEKVGVEILIAAPALAEIFRKKIRIAAAGHQVACSCIRSRCSEAFRRETTRSVRNTS